MSEQGRVARSHAGAVCHIPDGGCGANSIPDINSIADIKEAEVR